MPFEGYTLNLELDLYPAGSLLREAPTQATQLRHPKNLVDWISSQHRDLMAEDSWKYVWDKAQALLRSVFLLDGSLASRLQEVESSSLLYFLDRRPPDPKLKGEFEEMKRRWLDDVKPDMDNRDVSEFGEGLLTLILKVDRIYHAPK